MSTPTGGRFCSPKPYFGEFPSIIRGPKLCRSGNRDPAGLAGNEAHLHAFATTLTTPDLRSVPLYLHTSPEFAAKKLLAAGEQRLFVFTRVFRNREHGALHHPSSPCSNGTGRTSRTTC